jgi:CspA family cold shock protein
MKKSKGCVMPIGTVKFYHRDKGYGFIKPLDGGSDIFFHVNNLKESQMDDPILGVRVGYELGKSRSAKALTDPTKTVMAINLRYV